MLFVIIGTASAAYVGSNATEIASANDNDGIVGVENDLDILSNDASTYSGLSGEIGSGGNITLQHDYYTYDNGSTIEITVDGSVIDGDGAVIDMAESSIRAFMISASGVTIKNLTIKNANINGSGAAIYFGSFGFVEDCNFVNNIATSGGGAIFFNYDAVGAVINCNFVNNTATYSGGAIYIESDGRVENCNFVNNKVTFCGGSGGAVHFSMGYTYTTVINCNFTNNTASEGGAVFLWEYSEVRNCNFVNNIAWGTGGAVHFYSTFLDSSCLDSVENCNFTDNTAFGSGGAIYFDKGTYGNVTYCNFVNNSAFGSGGAVYFSWDGELGNCNFTNNSATDYGGTAYFCYTDYEDSLDFEARGNVKNCNFINNSAREGGAVYFNTHVQEAFSGEVTYYESISNVINCNFNGNIASTGSAIFFNCSSSANAISNSTFLNNNVNSDTLQVTQSGNNIEIAFMGRNNLLNVIYSNGDVNVINVTYGDVRSTVNTGNSSMVISGLKEECQNIFVTVVVNGVLVLNTTKVTDSHGKIVLNAIAGNYTITARYDGNSYYDRVETKATFNIVANETSLELSAFGRTAVAKISPKNATGNIIFIVKNESGIVKTDESVLNEFGTAELDLYGLKPGKYNINATYEGNINYYTSKANINHEIVKLNSTILIEVENIPSTEITAEYNFDKTIVIILKDSNGEVLRDAIVSINLNGIKEYLTDNNGQIKVLIKGLTPKTYVATIKYNGNENYMQSSTTAKITIIKQATKITTSNITTYGTNKNLTITLKNSQNSPITNTQIIVDLGTGPKTYATDSNGQVKIPTDELIPKTYSAKVTFEGNAYYMKSSVDVTLVVKKATPKITAKAKTFKTTTKTKKYTITLKDNDGKAIKKGTVYLKVGGKTYKATTNSKGKATFKITKLNNKGTYKATVTYKGNKYYNKATKKVTIKVKSVWKTVSKGSKNSAIVKKIQRALKNHGYYLEYNGHYLLVDGIFWDYTQMAVKEFQNDKYLKVTGKVDEKTARKLGII